MVHFRKVVIPILLLLFASQADSASPISKWVSLDSDLQNRIKRIIQTEVENREGFSVREDEILNTRMVEEERQRENAAYKSAIDSANREFARSRKRRDDLSEDQALRALPLPGSENRPEKRQSDCVCRNGSDV